MTPDKIKTSNNYIFLLLNLALLLDTLLYSIIVPMVPFYSHGLGITTSQLGWVFASYSLALLVTSTPMGWAVDTYGYKPVMTAGMVGLTLSTTAFIFSHSLPLLLLSRLLQGIAAAATWAAGLALVAVIFPSEVKGQKMGIAMTVSSLGTIIGPVLGGFLYQAAGYASPFLLIVVLGSLLSVLFYYSPLPGKNLSHRPDRPKILSLLAHRNIFWASLIAVTSSFGITMLEPLLPIELDHRFGMSSAGIGTLFGVLSLTFTISQPLFGTLSDRLGRKPLILLGLIGTAVVTPWLACAPYMWLIILLMGLLGVTYGAFSTPNLPLLAESTEAAFSAAGHADPSSTPSDSPFGTAFGIFNTVYSLGMMAGPLLGTSLAQQFGLKAVFNLYSVLLVIAAVGSYMGVKETAARQK